MGEEENYYPLLMNNYLADGNDGFTMLGPSLTPVEPFGTALFTTVQVIEWALSLGRGQRGGLDGRIKVYDSSDTDDSFFTKDELCTPFSGLDVCSASDSDKSDSQCEAKHNGVLIAFFVLSILLNVLGCAAGLAYTGHCKSLEASCFPDSKTPLLSNDAEL